MSDPTFTSMPSTPLTPEKPKKGNTGLMIGVVIAVLLCCCCLGIGVTLWFTGDAIVEALNAAGSFAP